MTLLSNLADRLRPGEGRRDVPFIWEKPMALVLLTNVTQYAGPDALDGLLAEGHHVACHDASFADAGTRAGFDDRQGKVTAFAGQSPEDIHDEIMARTISIASFTIHAPASSTTRPAARPLRSSCRSDDSANRRRLAL